MQLVCDEPLWSESHVGHTSGGSRSLVLNTWRLQPRHFARRESNRRKIPESNVAVIAKLKTLGSSFSVNPWTLALATTNGSQDSHGQVPSRFPARLREPHTRGSQRVVGGSSCTACSHRRADGKFTLLEAPRAAASSPRWCMQSAVQAPPSQIA